MTSFAPGTNPQYANAYSNWWFGGAQGPPPNRASFGPDAGPPTIGGRGAPANPYADVQDLMQLYPGVDPNELRRFRQQQEQAMLGEAADRFRADSAAVAPEYEKRRVEGNRAAAEAFAKKPGQQFGQPGPQGGRIPQQGMFRPGMAQPIQPPPQGTPYGWQPAAPPPAGQGQEKSPSFQPWRKYRTGGVRELF